LPRSAWLASEEQGATAQARFDLVPDEPRGGVGRPPLLKQFVLFLGLEIGPQLRLAVLLGGGHCLLQGLAEGARPLGPCFLQLDVLVEGVRDRGGPIPPLLVVVDLELLQVLRRAFGGRRGPLQRVVGPLLPQALQNGGVVAHLLEQLLRPMTLTLTLTNNQLLQRIYVDRAYTEVARLIGYEGVEMSAFWAEAKKLGIPQAKLLSAVYDLTRSDRREERPPRYELSGPAREACFQLLGPPPEHELHGRMREGPPLYSEEEERQWQQRIEEAKKQVTKKTLNR
jgi:hypothetical protein